MRLLHRLDTTDRIVLAILLAAGLAVCVICLAAVLPVLIGPSPY